MVGNEKAVTTGNSNGSHKSSESRQDHSSMATLYDAISDFKQHLADNGLGYLDEIKVDAGLQRFGKNKNFYYVFHSAGSAGICAGCYGDWSRDFKSNWCFKKNSKPLTPAERKSLSAVYAEAKAKKKQDTEARHAEARRISNGVWNKAQPAKPDHPYIVKKQIQGIEKYLRESKGNLIMPIYNNKRLVSLQYIRGDNFGKFFVKGSELKGSFMMLGSLKKPFNEIFICEGASTAWSVHTLANQAPTFIALNSGNLKNVALSVRKHYPTTKIIIACDNDIKKDNGINIGVMKGKEAAEAIRAYYSIPQFPDPTQAGDWNDLYLTCCAQQKGGASDE